MKIYKLFKIKNYLNIIKILINFLFSKFTNKNKFLNQQINNFHNLGWNYDISLKKLNNILMANQFEEFDDSKISMASQHLVAFCAINNNPKRILEIGTFDGSTAFLLSKIFPHAEVITIDLDDNSNEFQNTYNRSNKKYREDFLIQRKNNINNDRIRFIQDNSFNIQNYNLMKFDLIWIDGDHNYPVLAWDICNSFHLLNENGFLLCDDIYFHKSDAHNVLNYLNKEKILKTDYILKRVSNIFSANPFIKKHIAIIKKTKSIL